jgi:hypothetical protein
VLSGDVPPTSSRPSSSLVLACRGASAALSTSDNFHVMTLEASAWDSVADDMRAKYESSLQRELGLMGWSKLSSVALQILREAVSAGQPSSVVQHRAPSSGQTQHACRQ